MTGVILLEWDERKVGGVVELIGGVLSCGGVDVVD